MKTKKSKIIIEVSNSLLSTEEIDMYNYCCKELKRMQEQEENEA